jgi:fluoride exporter
VVEVAVTQSEHGVLVHPLPRQRTSRRRPRPRLRLSVILAISAGGFSGGLARYWITEAWPVPANGFPWSTLGINTAGAFTLALLLIMVIEVWPPTTYVRPAAGTGFLGAFTTFSAVVTSANRVAAHGHVLTAAGYVSASTATGLVAASLGLVLGRGIGSIRRHRARHVERGT